MPLSGKHIGCIAAMLMLLLPVAAQQPDLWSAVRQGNTARAPRQYLYHHTAKLKLSLNPVKTGWRTAMYLYQKKLTYQVAGTCLYTPSCSEFSRQCFEEYGLLKAGFLTLDRLSRCSPLMTRYLSRYDKIEHGGHVHYADPASRYRALKP